MRREPNPVSSAGQSHVEEASLLGVGPLVTPRVKKVPRDEPRLQRAGLVRGEPAFLERWQEDDWPLKTLGAVDRPKGDAVAQNVFFAVEVVVVPSRVIGQQQREVLVE